MARQWHGFGCQSLTCTSSLVLYNYIKSANLRFLSKIFVVSTVSIEAFPSLLNLRSTAGQSKFAADFSVNLLNLVNFTLEYQACDLLVIELGFETLDVGLLGEGGLATYGRSPINLKKLKPFHKRVTPNLRKMSVVNGISYLL